MAVANEAVMFAEGNTIDYTPAGAALLAGQVVDFGLLMVGIAKRPAAIGELTALAIRGHFKVIKQAGVAWTRGDVIYFDITAREADKTNTNVRMGFASQDAASGDVIGYVLVYPNV